MACIQKVIVAFHKISLVNKLSIDSGEVTV